MRDSAFPALRIRCQCQYFRNTQKEKSAHGKEATMPPQTVQILSAYFWLQLSAVTQMNGHPPGAIWPTAEFDDAQIREVYARFGLAMYMAQVLEHGMVNAVVVMKILPTVRSHTGEASWQAAIDSAFDNGFARTYGNMVRQLETLPEFPQQLLTRLKAAKDDRDILAHRFFRQNDMAFMNCDGRTGMIIWCEERIETFRALSDEIDAFLSPIQERYGLTEARLARLLEHLVEQARGVVANDEFGD